MDDNGDMLPELQAHSGNDKDTLASILSIWSQWWRRIMFGEETPTLATGRWFRVSARSNKAVIYIGEEFSIFSFIFQKLLLTFQS
jgi:hypothetical protein